MALIFSEKKEGTSIAKQENAREKWWLFGIVMKRKRQNIWPRLRTCKWFQELPEFGSCEFGAALVCMVG